jgi:electron transfer flavoprotein alpha subunit
MRCQRSCSRNSVDSGCSRMSESAVAENFKGVWVVAEQRRKRLMDVSAELLGGARQLSNKLETELAAVLLGYQIEDLAKELILHGADKVYLVDAPQLELYQSDIYPKILTDLVRQRRPEILLLGATAIGRDLAARAAANLRTGLTADCVNLSINSERLLVQTIPGFGGNVMVNRLCPNHRPQMATVRPGVMERCPRNESRTGEILKVEVHVEESDIKSRTVQMIEEETQEAPLERADIIVAGGSGVRSIENFQLLQELAQVLGGATGGTRPAVDKGWIPDERMIGQSGKTVHPRLYIGAGISGAMQHMVGIRDSKIIVAINNDAQAPIFGVADFGIVGDLCEILPCLIADFKEGLHKL